MRILTAHLDHLIVPPAEQRARHLAFHARMFAVNPPVLEPKPPIELARIERTKVEEKPVEAAQPEPPNAVSAAIIERTQRYAEGELLARATDAFALVQDGLRDRRGLSRGILLRRSVATAFELTQSSLSGPRRYQSIIAARHVGFAIGKQIGMSLPAIGRAFNKDHTTVLRGARRMRALVWSVVTNLSQNKPEPAQ